MIREYEVPSRQHAYICSWLTNYFGMTVTSKTSIKIIFYKFLFDKTHSKFWLNIWVKAINKR